MAIHTARVNQGPRSAEDKPVPSTAVSSTHPGLSLRQSPHSASREDRHLVLHGPTSQPTAENETPSGIFLLLRVCVFLKVTSSPS